MYKDLQTLGLSQARSFAEIRKAHRRLVSRFHPDRAPKNREAEYERKFIEVQQAFERLKKIAANFDFKSSTYEPKPQASEPRAQQAPRSQSPRYHSSVRPTRRSKRKSSPWMIPRINWRVFIRNTAMVLAFLSLMTPARGAILGLSLVFLTMFIGSFILMKLIRASFRSDWE